jgi:hypothetical protein
VTAGLAVAAIFGALTLIVFVAEIWLLFVLEEDEDDSPHTR